MRAVRGWSLFSEIGNLSDIIVYIGVGRIKFLIPQFSNSLETEAPSNNQIKIPFYTIRSFC